MVLPVYVGQISWTRRSLIAWLRRWKLTWEVAESYWLRVNFLFWAISRFHPLVRSWFHLLWMIKKKMILYPNLMFLVNNSPVESPWKLENFVKALKCNPSNSLSDSVHITLLPILRKHLEFLYDEGPQFASDCLRYLNRCSPDLVMRSVFTIEYLLIHGSGLKPSLEFSWFKPF